MDRQQAFDMVKSDLMEIFEIEEDSITPEATLMDDLGLDSIDGVDMMVRMQERTGKKVTPEETAEIIAQVDKDGDGQVDLDEFKEIFKLAPDMLPPGLKQVVDVGGLCSLENVGSIMRQRLTHIARMHAARDKRRESERGARFVGKCLFNLSG